MNKLVLISVFAVGVVAAGQALAQSCPSNTIRVSNVQLLLGGKTLCAARAPDRWKEFHSGGPASGPLIAYKLGPGHPMDPTETVGTWSAVNGPNSSVTHNYLGGSSFTWLVCQGAASNAIALVSVASAGTVSNAQVLSGQVDCP